MTGGVTWDATAVSRAITILNYSSENVASRTLTPPSNAGSNEAALATQVERINRVIKMASFCLMADNERQQRHTSSLVFHAVLD